MILELTFLFSGTVFGLSAGLSPGPLLTLVISETLKHGIREGVKVAIAPLISDLPIVLAAMFLFSRLSDMKPALGMIFLSGSLFLAYLGYESLVFKGFDADIRQTEPQSLKKGIVANFLNPSPYLFWISVGSPEMLKALKINAFSAAGFILCFYLFLVGSKILLAVIVGKSRVFLKSSHYILSIRFLGIILLIFAVFFFRDALKQFIEL